MMTMTREQAIKAMRNGQKVTHRYFTSEEWATEENGEVVLEDGVRCSPSEFWRDRMTSLFEDGWALFQNTYIYNGKKYLVTDEEPKNGDFVLTENYGAWIFEDFTGTGSAPMPYWANKKTCKKLTLIK